MSDIGSKKISEIMDSQEARLGAMVVRTQMAIRTREPDRELTADLIMRAIGSRSRRKFAEEIGANVSSVSRILNGQVNEISPTLLAKIAFHATPDSKVTLDELMEAQGLTDPESRVQLAKRYEEDCRRILVDELLSRGYAVQYKLETSAAEYHSSRIMFDVTLETNALGIDDSLWLVECKMMSQYSMLPVGIGRSQMWLDSAMGYYYRGGKAGRISLIIDHRAVFENLKSRLEELTIPDEISVILISTRRGKILDEYVAPLTDGRTPRFVFGGNDNVAGNANRNTNGSRGNDEIEDSAESEEN